MSCHVRYDVCQVPEFCNLLTVPLRVRAEHQVTAVMQRRERRRMAMVEAETVLLQLQLVDDRRSKQRKQVRRSRELEALIQLLSIHRPIAHVSAFPQP
jgi:hypothetical protein